jgi:broad specificity phosphatase PhoE
VALFAPPDAPGLPEAIRAYHAARMAWVAVWLDPPASHPEEWARFARATDNLAAELRRRGGAWTVGRITHRLGRKFGVEIEQATQAED